MVLNTRSLARSDRRSKPPGWLLFVVVSVLWGIPYLFNDIALREIGPLWIAAGRTIIAGLVLGPVLLRGGRWRLLITRWRALLLVAIVEVVLPVSLITFGQEDVPSGTAGVLIALEPIFVAVITLILVRDHGLALTGWLGLVIGITGVGVLLGIELTGPSALLIVGAALSYAVGAVLISRLFADADSLTTTAAMILIAAPILVALALVAEPVTVPTPTTWVALLVLGSACSAAGFTTFFALIRRSGPTIASLTTYASPIIAVLAGFLVLGESITLLQALSSALILVGAALVLRKKRPTAAPARDGSRRAHRSEG
ncbi:EamA family transporter [Promicromonospora sp. MEB111]|uniref:DMT family transporter n=1 Tax=Promicromonospora sp. MEB111 TaxID=3040301 RepID=UPI00254AFF40|nr:EamA family transporter [Promicromonospora sp. MEB111]